MKGQVSSSIVCMCLSKSLVLVKGNTEAIQFSIGDSIYSYSGALGTCGGHWVIATLSSILITSVSSVALSPATTLSPGDSHGTLSSITSSVRLAMGPASSAVNRYDRGQVASLPLEPLPARRYSKENSQAPLLPVWGKLFQFRKNYTQITTSILF